VLFVQSYDQIYTVTYAHRMIKIILPAISLVISSFSLSAQQRLKDVQVTSVRAPEKIKVDGRLNEWEDSFQAYNKRTRLYYTLSNNEKYLFLAVTSTDAANITKITAGGLTFAISAAGKKKEKDASTITFPVVGRSSGRGQNGPRGVGRQGGRSGTDTAAVAARRKEFVASSKEIKVLGFKDITDTLISIYNEYGIKTAIGYDSLGNYNYELAVPLRLLGISADSTLEIAYNLKVNGLSVNDGGRMNNGRGNGGGFSGGAGGNRGGGGQRGGNAGRSGGRNGGADFEDLTSPSDFWGKYTLARP